MAQVQPRVAVITGASAGIGEAAAVALAAEGWRVIACGRNVARAAAAEQRIRAASTGGGVDMLVADLALVSQARDLARRIAALTDRVDLLVNNAGGMTDHFELTAEGLEANFAGNHLGPFVLTEGLLPLLRRAAAGRPAGSVRIVNTASDGSEMVPGLDLADLQNLANWSPELAYCSAKLANVLHARALAGRLAADGIVAHAVHPGQIRSNFFEHVPQRVRDAFAERELGSSADGADTIVYLATSAQGGQSTGQYWHRRALRPHNPVVDDAEFVAAFWAATEALVAAVPLSPGSA